MNVGSVQGHLMFKLGDQSISCNCIGEPYSTAIAERFERVVTAAETVLRTFEKDEAQGFRSRDRQYAISILRAALSRS